MNKYKIIDGEIDNICEFIKNHGGDNDVVQNTKDYPHVLFVEVNDGYWCSSWRFDSINKILQILGSNEFEYFLALFVDKPYLISIETV